MKYVSALVTAASGKIRGMVASHNRGGTYLKGKTIPVNPSSVLQGIVRGALRTAINAWTTVLTSAQRAAWLTYAQNTPFTDTLGNTIQLTGQNAYLRQAVVRTQASLAPISPGPTVFDLGTFTPPTLTLTAGAGTATLAFSTADAWVGDGTLTAMMVWTSNPQNGSVNFFKGPFRFAGMILGGATSPATLTLPGSAPATGNKVFFQVRVSRSDGRLSDTFLGSGTA